MRPKKERWIRCKPGTTCFRPQFKDPEELEGVILELDELEAVRLSDLNGLKQEQAAEQMRISRPTFSRIIASARKKTADALVNGKAIKIKSRE